MATTEEQRAQLLEQIKAGFFLPRLIEHKYELKQVIGEGSYGVVCSAYDQHSNALVAVKRIIKVFDELPEAIRTLRELKFLRLLKQHENIISILDVLLPSDVHRFNDVFVVLELMPTDLTRVLRSQIVLSNDHIRWLAYQLLRGAHYLHASNVLHRDLKPSNILINAMCDLRICDFGLARAAATDPSAQDHVFWTDYVATRWYRAPELIMTACTRYTSAIDMWSLGCIIAEMLNNGRPLFPGVNSRDQLDRIVDVCGTPTPEALSAVRNPKAREYISLLPKRPRRPLADILPSSVDPDALVLLTDILDFDPAKRPTALEALAYPYFKSLHDPDVVEQAIEPLPEHEFDFEKRPLDIDEVRRLLLEEILHYHPDKRESFMSMANGNKCGSDGVDQEAAGPDSATVPTLRYEPTDQATRFREAMRAAENEHAPPKPWDSMPNQRLRGLCPLAHPALRDDPESFLPAGASVMVTTPLALEGHGNAQSSTRLVSNQETERLQSQCEVVAPGMATREGPEWKMDEGEEEHERYSRQVSGESVMSSVGSLASQGGALRRVADTTVDVMDEEADTLSGSVNDCPSISQQMRVQEAQTRVSVTGESMDVDVGDPN